jgi:hypothetical protein
MYMLSFIFLALFAATQAKAQGPTDCSDLFISELYIEKNPNLDSATQQERPFDLNYAVEIFNPTTNPIDLLQYSLELTMGTSVTTIPLSGSLNGGSVYVLANTNCDVNLQLMADSLSPYLDFGAATILTLKHNTDVIDKIGQDGVPTADSFDFPQFLNDPYGYLSTKHIDLNDFQNVDMRRGMFVTYGDPNFTNATDIIGNWAYYPNTDRTDLGQHYGICNKALSDDIIGFNQPSFTLYYQNTSIKDPLTLKVNGTANGFLFGSPNVSIEEVQVSGSANICNNGSIAFNELNWDVSPISSYSPIPPCQSITFTYNGGSNTVRAVPTIFSNSGTSSTIQLVSHTSTLTIDPATSQHVITYKRSFSAGTINEQNDVRMYPTYTASSLTVESKKAMEYSICDMQGRSLLHGEIKTGKQVIDVASLAGGMYLLYVKSGSTNTLAQKFTKL